MDPLSGSASIVTLLGIAGSCCGSLCASLRSFSDAPADIRYQCVSIQSLQTTFKDLGALYADVPASYQFNRGLASKVSEFLGKTQDAEKKIALANAMLSRGTTIRTWTRLKWSLTTHRWLKRLFDDLEFWNMIFSQEVAAVQT